MGIRNLGCLSAKREFLNFPHFEYRRCLAVVPVAAGGYRPMPQPGACQNNEQPSKGTNEQKSLFTNPQQLPVVVQQINPAIRAHTHIANAPILVG